MTARPVPDGPPGVRPDVPGLPPDGPPGTTPDERPGPVLEPPVRPAPPPLVLPPRPPPSAVVPPGPGAFGDLGAAGTPMLLSVSTQIGAVEQPVPASNTRPASTAKLARQ